MLDNLFSAVVRGTAVFAGTSAVITIPLTLYVGLSVAGNFFIVLYSIADSPQHKQPERGAKL